MIYYEALRKEQGINFMTLNTCATSFKFCFLVGFAWNNRYVGHRTSHTIPKDDYK